MARTLLRATAIETPLRVRHLRNVPGGAVHRMMSGDAGTCLDVSKARAAGGSFDARQYNLLDWERTTTAA